MFSDGKPGHMYKGVFKPGCLSVVESDWFGLFFPPWYDSFWAELNMVIISVCGPKQQDRDPLQEVALVWSAACWPGKVINLYKA